MPSTQTIYLDWRCVTFRWALRNHLVVFPFPAIHRSRILLLLSKLSGKIPHVLRFFNFSPTFLTKTTFLALHPLATLATIQNVDTDILERLKTKKISNQIVWKCMNVLAFPRYACFWNIDLKLMSRVFCCEWLHLFFSCWNTLFGIQNNIFSLKFFLLNCWQRCYNFGSKFVNILTWKALSWNRVCFKRSKKIPKYK